MTVATNKRGAGKIQLDSLLSIFSSERCGSLPANNIEQILSVLADSGMKYQTLIVSLQA
jgi:hypothetical protein